MFCKYNITYFQEDENMKKRFLAILLCLCMVAALLPATVFAAATGSGGTVGATGIDTIFGSGGATLSGTAITLSDNVTVGTTVEFASGTWTLDLAGHTLAAGSASYPAITISGAAVTIMDSSTDGIGAIKGANGNSSRINGGTAVLVTGGSLTLSGGSVTGGNGGEDVICSNGGSGGDGISASGIDISISNAEVTVSGGNGVSADSNGGSGGTGISANAITISNATVTAKGGNRSSLGGSTDGSAMSVVPTLTGVSAVASTNNDGTGAEDYDSTKHSSYKYFHSEALPYAIQSGIGSLAYGDTVYYGTYNSTTNVPWYIIGSDGVVKKTLDANPKSLFLLSQYTLGSSNFRDSGDCGYYNYSTNSNTADSSNLKEVMDGLYNGNGTLFTASEQNAIKQTILAGNSMYDGTQDVNAYLFPLSYAEGQSIVGIGNGNALLQATSIDDPEFCTAWWFRSSNDDNYAFCVYVDGSSDYSPIHFTYDVRPAFNLDLNSVLFTSAAAGGKSASGMDSGLTAVGTNSTSDWKLTLKDSGRSFVAGSTEYNSTTNTVTAAYTGAAIGTNEYISAVIKDTEGNVKYYGRLKNIAAAGDANGTVDVTLPTGLDSASDTLYIFSEQYNGDIRPTTQVLWLKFRYPM